MSQRHRIAVIGYGNMGAHWCEVIAADPRWELCGVCDSDRARREQAAQRHAGIPVSADAEAFLTDPGIEVVGLVTLADARPRMLRAALEAGKHVAAEKPLAADVPTEWRLLEAIERSDRIVAVNLFNRNAWYHEEARKFIAAGQIGRLGIVRVCHMTAGMLPGTGYGPEGPPFHNCGMHYLDVIRWHAASNVRQWHAQGLRMWDEPQPWWVTAHGTCDNGVAFEITIGFVYGQAARNRRNNSYCELIGTHGVVSIDHDFDIAHCRLNGIDETRALSRPYGDKQLDVFFTRIADSLDAGRRLNLPDPRDAVIASDLSQQMLDAACAGECPAIGAPEQLQELIRLRGWEHRLKQAPASAAARQ